MRGLIEPGHLKVPIDRQCDLLGLSRSGYYYQPQGESALNQRLINLLDEQYPRMPFYGVEKSGGRLPDDGMAPAAGVSGQRETGKTPLAHHGN